MAAQTHDTWAETRKIQKEFSGFYKIAGGLVLVIIGIMIGAAMFHNDEGYWGNILSEVLGIGFAVFVLDQRAEQRAERRQIKDLQERLVMEAGSSSNETAKRAIDELRHHGWLTGESGLLKGKSFENASLNGVNLSFANLEQTYFYRCTLDGANLEGADMCSSGMQDTTARYANLEITDLSDSTIASCDFRDTFLEHTSMSNVHAKNTDFRDSYMSWVFLHGANMEWAYLQGAKFTGDHMNASTVLPDGSKWTPNTDMTRFTNPNHPQFWNRSHAMSSLLNTRNEE